MNLNEEKFLTILKDHQGIIRKIANSYCKNMDDRNDLIQEITIQLWRSRNKYNDDFKLSTWIFKIALNVAISFYRKNYRRQQINLSIPEDPVFLYEDEDPTLSDNIKQLYFFISKLDEFNRALILLYLEEYSYDEIAKTLGITKTNVATKISRIKRLLRKDFNIKK